MLLSSTMARINGDSGSPTVTTPLSSETFTPQSAETLPKVSPQELQEEMSLINYWPGEAGATALRQVQFLASKASESADAMAESQYSLATRRRNRMQSTNNSGSRSTDNFRAPPRQQNRRRRKSIDPKGEGGGVFNNAEYNTVAKEAKVNKLKRSDLEVSSTDRREEQVWTALANLELDSTCCLSV